ncbi:MAG TPA: pilus assembly protein N-terminal domain-containing protein [Oculatellaceae cyanobacterium]|jgi:pilus assembly protein CpaC
MTASFQKPGPTPQGIARTIAAALSVAILSIPVWAEDVSSRLVQGESATAYHLQYLDEGNQQGKPLQGSITSIRVTRGRSQIVKFAQPVVRMSIAEPTIADVIPLSPDQILINGKLRGVTSLIVWDEQGQEGIFDLYVQNDASEVLDAIHAIIPNEKVQARVTDDSIILSGKVSNTVILDEIRKTAAAYGYRDDKFIDLTDTPVPQVMLEVKVAEASRSVGKELKTAFNYSKGHLTTTRLANAVDSGIISALQRATQGILPGNLGPLGNTMSGTNVGGLTGMYRFNDHFQAFWDLLETSGKINTLANPTLVCTHGRTASFLAGGEFPFVGSVDQNGSPIISFKEFGVKLDFTPWIAIDSGRIELKVAPEVSNVDTSNCVTSGSGAQVCGISKRRTETTVELNDGDSLMISGILTREEQNTYAKVPFIGNVPILGNMFKNANMKKSDRELVVVITPHIVKSNDYGKVLGKAQ